MYSLDVLVEEEVVDDEFYGFGCVALSSFLWIYVELDLWAAFSELVGEEADSGFVLIRYIPPTFVFEVLVGFLQFSYRELGGWFVWACEFWICEPDVEIFNVLLFHKFQGYFLAFYHLGRSPGVVCFVGQGLVNVFVLRVSHSLTILWWEATSSSRVSVVLWGL